MYYEIVRQCTDSLRQASVWLGKAESLAMAKKFDVGVLLNARLAPDMGTFIYQIQSACDYVKGAAAWLSGQDVPRHPDVERTVEELRERLRATIAFVESIPAERYSDASKRRITLSWAKGRDMSAEDYVMQMTMPNVYFHLVTAYDILRHNGVEIGKKDFWGEIRLVETS
jgi:hypothetical protein